MPFVATGGEQVRVRALRTAFFIEMGGISIYGVCAPKLAAISLHLPHILVRGLYHTKYISSPV